MGRPRNPVPSYRFHKASGQAIVTVYNPDGSARDITLGRYDSPESRAAYARVCAELRAGNVYVSPSASFTVAALILEYWRFAEGYYRHADGRPTSEPSEIRYALRPLKKLYGDTPAAEFGPRALVAVRAEMVAAGLSRPVANRRTDRIRRMFRWAVAEELVPASVAHGLREVAGLKAGRTTAPEPKPVGPVPEADYEATLPKLPRMARAVVEVMRYSGMRPGEVLGLTLAEVDMSGETWVYRPARHKNAHRGKRRAVPLGPKAQAVLSAHLAGYVRFGLLPSDPTAKVFCAARETARRLAERRAGREGKRTPSEQRKMAAAAKRKGVRAPKPGYTRHALAHAVTVAARKAGVGHWHPNQLRHARLTEVRARFGLEAAQVVGGHARADITQTYAARDEKLAAEIAGRTG